MVEDASSFLMGPKFMAIHHRCVAQYPPHLQQCHQPQVQRGCSSLCDVWRAALVEKENLKGAKEVTRSEDKKENVQQRQDKSKGQTKQDCMIQPLIPAVHAPAGIAQWVRTGARPWDGLTGHQNMCWRHQSFRNLCEGPGIPQGSDKVVHLHRKVAVNSQETNHPESYTLYVNISRSESSLACNRLSLLAAGSGTEAKFPRKVAILWSIHLFCVFLKEPANT